jgi:alkanesulfonate monooxygenase SsuD/methylene tetrahydromethanopterin reductase-like flavin-dependent oxidoreductase (luciferase family)
VLLPSDFRGVPVGPGWRGAPPWGKLAPSWLGCLGKLGERVAKISPVLRLNMTGCGRGPDRALDAERYQAALAMADYADRAGFAIVNVEEHQDTGIGWMTAPLVMAGLILGRTSRVQVRGSAILVTLYDPLRLAQDIATLDLASRGRFILTAGQGYRPSEYHMMDRDFATRGAWTDFVLETLLKAWAGDPFEYRGQTIRVSPLPYTQPHPPLYVGGMSRIAARRAARLGLPFFPAQPTPELEEFYLEECARLGTQGRVIVQREMTLWFIAEDPDEAWEAVGPCFLKESVEYSSWSRPGVDRKYANSSLTVADLRRQGVYEILTPDEALARMQAAEAEYMPILHPLAGGIPLDRAWRCLELFGEALGRVDSLRSA